MRPPRVLAHSWQVNSSSWEFLNEQSLGDGEEGGSANCNRDSALSTATDATTSCQTAIRLELFQIQFCKIGLPFLELRAGLGVRSQVWSTLFLLLVATSAQGY